ncbi:MAG TPA: type II toxin-antitoxin system RelE/ParE family toxin [Candidatus Omnitrophica bacterium]|nr:type II toxin-antitoxin system RelE/ParE family toxin [Candidatus Omnitrophota bacterium]
MRTSFRGANRKRIRNKVITYSFTKYAYKQLKKLPANIQKRIIKKIKFYISTSDPLHFADTIEGKQDKGYRFRIGDYRVIFDWGRNNHILVTKVFLRGEAYRLF